VVVQLTVVVQQTGGIQDTHGGRGDVTGRLDNLTALRALSAVQDLQRVGGTFNRGRSLVLESKDSGSLLVGINELSVFGGLSILRSLEVLIVLLHGGAVGDITIELLLVRLPLPSGRLRRDGIVQGHEALELSQIIGVIVHFYISFGGL